MKKHVSVKQVKDSFEKLQILSKKESQMITGGKGFSPLYGIRPIYKPLYGIIPV